MADVDYSFAAGANGNDHGIPTRTVAIIKPHALQSRFDIEPRLSQAGFEIVKERQMEFDVETDPQTLFELFGDDYECFAEGPVWVYVLERRRAVETWLELMGPADPHVARQTDPHSLRALYGTTIHQNGLMGPTSDDQAEIQIASLFASSPPFPTTELPLTSDDEVASSIAPSFALTSVGASSDANGAGTSQTSEGSKQPRAPLPSKVRAIPSTNATPDIQPRMSRAAALRKSLSTGTTEAGVPSVKSSPRAPISKERLAQTFADVPGHGFRSQKIEVASTAPPRLAPRMTKAAALRLGIPIEPTPQKKSPISAKTATPTSRSDKTASPLDGKSSFEGVPGHKRRESFTIASTRAPTVAPKLNKAATLRAQKPAAPPSSFNFRSGEPAPPLSRRNSLDSGSKSGPNSRPSLSRTNSRSSTTGPPVSASGSISRAFSSGSQHRTSASVAMATPSAPRASVRARPGSATAIRTTSAADATSASTSDEVADGADAVPRTVAAAHRPRPSISSINPPTMQPRQNKAAMLRAAKMAAAAPAGKGVKPGKPVSTF